AEDRFVEAVYFGKTGVGVFVLVADILGVIYAAIAGCQKLTHDPQIARAHIQQARAIANSFKVQPLDVTESFTRPPVPDRKVRDLSREELLSPPVVGVRRRGAHEIGRSCL